MVSSSATTVREYLAELPNDRRKEIRALVKLIDQNMPTGYVKEMRWGMIVYSVPLDISGPTYNNQPLACVAVASQKNYISVYLMAIYASNALSRQFEKLWMQGSKKLNKGKSCVRFKSNSEANFDAIAWAVAKLDPAEFTKLYLDSCSK